MLSWFSTQTPPRLIATSLLAGSAWTSYVALIAEPRVHRDFYETLYANLAKHPARTLDEALKVQAKARL